MKKAVVLVLVLLAVFSSQLFPETLDCSQSFELGKIVAKEEYKACGWYWLGIGLNALYLVGYIPSIAYNDVATILFGSGILVIHTSALIAAMALPKRSDISPSSSGVELKCYRDGYIRRARWKNCGALLLGDLTGFIVVCALGFLLAGPS